MSLPRPCDEHSNTCNTLSALRSSQQPAARTLTAGITKAEVPPIQSQPVPSHLKKQTNCNRMIGQFWHETYTALHSRNTFIAWCFVFFTFHFSKSDTFYTNIHNTYTCYIINWLYIRIIENTDLNRKSEKNEKYFLLISFRNWFINYFST